MASCNASFVHKDLFLPPFCFLPTDPTICDCEKHCSGGYCEGGGLQGLLLSCGPLTGLRGGGIGSSPPEAPFHYRPSSRAASHSSGVMRFIFSKPTCMALSCDY